MSQKWLYMNIIILLTSVVITLGARSDGLNFKDICKNSKGTFSIAQSELVIAEIDEGESTTVFMNFAPEYVFKCKTNPWTRLTPKINFEPNPERYKVNKYRGKI